MAHFKVKKDNYLFIAKCKHEHMKFQTFYIINSSVCIQSIFN
jgi:hypothetical protein